MKNLLLIVGTSVALLACSSSDAPNRQASEPSPHIIGVDNGPITPNSILACEAEIIPKAWE